MTLQEKGLLLLQWYKNNKRDLPWRHTRDPYKIWISEIMLQQTRVDTVIEYYHRFLLRFPDIKALAHSTEEAVLEAWKGLGYYSRAKNIHKAAKWMWEFNKGQFPQTWEEIKKLPGIGDYTAGAISSIAFNEPRPAVDGNVLRVISRMEGSYEDIGTEKTRKNIERIEVQMIPEGEARDYIQALMELGAMICVPLSPRCELCPAHDFCIARISNRQSELPLKKKKEKPPEEIEYQALLVLFEGHILMEFRENDTLLGGMWGVPLDEKHGLKIKNKKSLGKVSHVFSHRIWKMEVILGELENTANLPPNFRFIQLAELESLAIPKAFQKVLALLPKVRNYELPSVAETPSEYNKSIKNPNSRKRRSENGSK